MQLYSGLLVESGGLGMHRIITASVLLLLVLWLLLLAPLPWVYGGVVCLLACASYESIGLCMPGLLLWQHLGYTAVLLAMLCSMLYGIYCYPVLEIYVYITSALAWLLATYVITRVGVSRWKRRCWPISAISSLIFSIFWLLPFAQAVLFLYQQQCLLFICCLIWLTDTVAYYTGKRWGRRKLLAAVSPNKTWLGAISGWVAAVITSYCLSNVSLSIIAAIAVIFAVVGDLGESFLKRLTGVKDSGKILPGHGGILDRIDSLLAALPIFSLGIVWLTM
jgi:phosphatidate cytidylyltransferase